MRNHAVRVLIAAAAWVVLVAARAELRPEAREWLARADERLSAQDHAGALDAYVEAVKVDRAAADLETIRLYAPAPFTLGPPPPPPPPPPPGTLAPIATKAPDQLRADAAPSLIAALRQFLEIHPDHAGAQRDLVVALPNDEGLALANKLLAARADDAQLLYARGLVRFRAGQQMEGLADLERAATRDPENAEVFYAIGVAAYETVAKNRHLPADEKRELLHRGLAALERSRSLLAEHFESLVYRSLLLREEAKLESNPAVREKLLADADAARQLAASITKVRLGERRPDTSAMRPGVTEMVAEGRYRVGGEVRAPVVRHRVEPVIPEAARTARISGIVILEVVIDTAGTVREAKVLKPLPYGVDDAALEAVKQWTFVPATLHGRAVEVVYFLTVNVKPE